MANAEARYKNHRGEDLHLLLDIDLGQQKIRELKALGNLTQKYADELVELESLTLGKTISDVLAIKREKLTKEALVNGRKPMAPLTLWLLHRAIENYLGSEAVLAEASDRLCLCFGVGVRDLKKQILGRPDYGLKHLIAETFATSACGSCLPAINKTMEDLRLANGQIEKGCFVKVKGLYPGALIIMLDDLRQKWMKREELEGQFAIELIHIEGLHLTLSVKTANDLAVEKDRAEKILQALSDYYKSETGILFFLHLFS